MATPAPPPGRSAPAPPGGGGGARARPPPPGGEPLVRRDLERVVAMLAPLSVDLTLTTNGALLAGKARALRDAGLDRVTGSLGSLDDATFMAMNSVRFPVARALEGTRAGR